MQTFKIAICFVFTLFLFHSLIPHKSVLSGEWMVLAIYLSLLQSTSMNLSPFSFFFEKSKFLIVFCCIISSFYTVSRILYFTWNQYCLFSYKTQNSNYLWNERTFWDIDIVKEKNQFFLRTAHQKVMLQEMFI